MTTTQHLLPIGTDRNGSGPPENSARVKLGGISRPTLYDLVKKGEITHVKIGRRGFIASASIDAYIERLTAAAQKVSA